MSLDQGSGEQQLVQIVSPFIFSFSVCSLSFLSHSSSLCFTRLFVFSADHISFSLLCLCVCVCAFLCVYQRVTRVSVSLLSQPIVVVTHTSLFSVSFQVVIRSRLDQSMEEAQELKVNHLSVCSSHTCLITERINLWNAHCD